MSYQTQKYNIFSFVVYSISTYGIFQCTLSKHLSLKSQSIGDKAHCLLMLWHLFLAVAWNSRDQNETIETTRHD